MTSRLTLDATFEKGVFIPDRRPTLADHERVRLIVESTQPARGDNAVRGIGGPGRRIQIAPALANEIALSDAFNPEEV